MKRRLNLSFSSCRWNRWLPRALQSRSIVNTQISLVLSLMTQGSLSTELQSEAGALARTVRTQMIVSALRSIVSLYSTQAALLRASIRAAAAKSTNKTRLISSQRTCRSWGVGLEELDANLTRTLLSRNWGSQLLDGCRPCAPGKLWGNKVPERIRNRFEQPRIQTSLLPLRTVK